MITSSKKLVPIALIGVAVFLANNESEQTAKQISKSDHLVPQSRGTTLPGSFEKIIERKDVDREAHQSQPSTNF